MVKEAKKVRLERKLILSMIIIFLVVMLSTSFTIIIGFIEDEIESSKKDLVGIARAAREELLYLTPEQTEGMDDDEINTLLAEYQNIGKSIDRWLEHGADDYYNKCYDRLIEFRYDYGLNDVFFYKAKRDENGKLVNDMTIIFDVPDYDDKQYQLGEEYGASQAFETIKKVYETRETQIVNRLVANSSGFVLVAFEPVKYADGTVCAVAGVEADIKSIVWRVFAENYFIIIDSVANFIVFGVVIFIFLRLSIVKPVRVISEHINQFVSSEEALSFTPITEIHTNDEIEQIADDFNSLAQRTIDYTKNLAVKTSTQERHRVDYDVANQMRKVISSELSYPAFPERSDFDLCASLNHTKYNKCSFCNYFFTDTNRLVIVVGESLGDNLASMIFSVLSVSYIKCFSIMGFDPYKIASETNNQLCSIEKKDKGLTVAAIIADIDLKTGVMRYVNAGMPPILIKKPGENFALAKAELPFTLGQMRGVSFEQNTLQLNQGSVFFLTSFGVTEMNDPKGNKYGFERLTNVMNRITGNVYDLDKAIKELENDLDSFRCDAPVPTDTTILGFRYFG